MIKICFYCDSIFSVGGVQRILAVIAGAISAKHEVTILTLDKPEQEDLNMYELGQRNIRFRYISLPPIGKWEYLPCKTYSYLYKKRIIPQIPITSQWYGYSSFPHTQRKVLIGELNNENYDIIGWSARFSVTPTGQYPPPAESPPGSRLDAHLF